MKYLMICFALLISLSSCSKEDIESKLPPKTTTGANTAGFIVDGKTVVLPSNSVSSVPGSGTRYGIDISGGRNLSSPNNSRYFTIEIVNSGKDKTYSAQIRIHEAPQEPMKYVFGQHTGLYGGGGPNYPQMVVIVSGNNLETEWYYSSWDSGQITFTRVDTVNRIYSSTFSSTLYNRFDNTKTMEITQGRFDINLNTLNK